MAIGLQSNQITFIDFTDNRAFNVNIACNLPTTQIYDVDKKTYTPSWTKTPLQLTPQIYLGSTELKAGTEGLSIQWRRQDGTNNPSNLATSETPLNGVLTVSRNNLGVSTSGFLTYICTVTYDGMEAVARLSFNLTSSGSSGNDGTNAYVHIKYGTSVTPSVLLDSPSEYMGIYSGSSPTPPTSYTEYRWYKIKGDDGTSVKILGSAYYNGTLTDDNIGQALNIYSDEAFLSGINITTHPTLIDGDAYIVSGYLCVYNSQNDSFICAGQVQGPQGEPGITYYTWIKYADSEISRVLYDTPTAVSGLKYIGIAYNKLTQTPSDNYADYTWAKFVGEDGAGAKYVIVNGDQVFKSTNNGTSYSPSEITLTATLYGGLKGYQWYKDNVIINGATSSTYRVSASDLTSTATYKCVSEDDHYDSITLVKLSDGAIGDAASFAFLTNENMVFLANSEGMSLSSTNICNVVAYTGNTKVTPIIGDIMGIPDGVTVTVGDIIANEIPLTIKVDSNVNLPTSGIIYIPITSPISTALALKWQRADAAKNSITFQLYAPNGYLLSQDLDSLTLETFAYDGDIQITTDATYVWSKQENNEWVIIEEQTGTQLIITKDDILKSKSYKCDMTYGGLTYSATATIQDKNDIYNSVLCISSNTQSASGENYWVLYSLIYSDTTEADPLLGPISITEPETPLKDDYWYAIDETNLTVTLKQFNGTTWEDTEDTQQFDYHWSMSRDNDDNVPVGQNCKVNIISSHDFTSTTTLMCEIVDSTDGILTRATLSLTDVSDPIVSETEPTNVKHGQIWIKKNSDGTFLMFIWDAVEESWVISDADNRNRVYTSRPDSYNAGDLWITASDEDHGVYLHGTLLQAQVSSDTYDSDDWSPTLKYDQDINDMKEQLDKLSQYVTINSDGLRIGARTESGQLSPFTSLFTSTELSFYQNSDKLLTLANNKLTAPSVEVENHLQVNNMISLGNLRLTIENNGSFSFTVVS